MGKNFNSFNDLIKSRSEATFKSFQDLAKSATSVNNPEQVNLPPVEKIEESSDVVSNLIEKLDETNPEKLITLNESAENEGDEPKLEGKNLEEALDNLIKRIDNLAPTSTEKSEEKDKPTQVEEKEEKKETEKAYRVFRDRDETFECKLAVEGTSLADSKVRLVLESEPWNFVFYGKVYGNGQCVIPIKKGIPLVEGVTGKIKLEVIAEDQLFIGWEDTFKIAASKKVKVNLKEQKSVTVSFNKQVD